MKSRICSETKRSKAVGRLGIQFKKAFKRNILKHDLLVMVLVTLVLICRLVFSLFLWLWLYLCNIARRKKTHQSQTQERFR